ncbi:MAG: hypothetical protein EAZ61_08125 [Oscillatoriales cyanobacterium]|nr:MAG: hypothetical protein EAZ61_08125 [Oscillatoriales cyanobacterium]
MPDPVTQPNTQADIKPNFDRFRLETTADGSQTFYSNEFNQLFHSHFGAHQEAEAKFVQVTRLAERAAERSHLTLIDVCYGLGYNTATALTTIWQANPQCRVHWYGLEADRDVPRAAIAANLLQPWPTAVRHLLTELADAETLDRDTLQAHLLIGDARQTITQILATNPQADAIFLDPFAPPDCPQLWSVEFLGNVARCLAPDGYLATYSCAAAVRSALIAAGLHIGSTPPVGRNTHGTAARWIAEDLTPLDRRAHEHLYTRAAIPYRDPSGTDSAETLHARRSEEQLRSSLEATTRWKKRWQQPLEGQITPL